MNAISRRGLITSGLAGAAAVSGVAVAARIAGQHHLIPPDYGGLYGCGHTLTYAAQRLLVGNSNAREFAPSQISKTPHPKGRPPKGDEFLRLRAGGFKDWRLNVDGMVNHVASFSIAELKSYPSRTQITQLICEEGWSYIAQWTGVPLSHILDLVGIRPQAAYAVYYAMDGRVEVIDLDDAWHAQTLLAYGMNGGDIPVGHGGPLRLRVPRQLGYKSRKFIHRLTLTDTLQGLRLDTRYSWYAGI
jgi:DMSO/TMAO reductase YedYZ molybdopterin-dependent catalytic subunit